MHEAVTSPCTRSSDWCCTFLIGTNRIEGSVTAPQMEAASGRVVLALLAGAPQLTNFCAISRTVWPWSWNSLAPWWASEHASMPIRQGWQRGDQFQRLAVGDTGTHQSGWALPAASTTL
jgi:hypothetical protein